MMEENEMITINKNEVKIKGNVVTLLAEVTLGIDRICQVVSENSIYTAQEVQDQMFKTLKVQKLIDAGMTLKEAQEIVG